jgi:hypothetical protein
MNDETTNLDQADEDILSYTVSDEALEAADRALAGTGAIYGTYGIIISSHRQPGAIPCC